MPDSVDVAMTLSNLGVVARGRGDFARAEDFHRRSLAIREKLAPGSLDVAASLKNLGVVARRRGETATAEDYYRRALAIEEALAPGSPSLARSLGNLANVLNDRGDPAAAEAVARRGLTSLLGTLGDIARRRGDAATADYYRRALAATEKLAPASLRVALELHNLGAIARERGDLGSAEKSHRRALEIREKLAPGTTEQAESLHELGLVYQRQGRREAAVESFLRALDALESQNARLGGTEDVRSSFAAGYGGYYHDAIETLVDLGRAAEALHVLERSRARSPLALLAERDLAFSADLSPELRRERNGADAEYDRVQARIARLDPIKDEAAIEKAFGQLRELRATQEGIVSRIRKASPHFASLHYPDPLDLAGVRAALDPGTLLLSYSVGSEGTVLFAVQPAEVPGPGLFVSRLAVGEKALREKVAALRQAAQRPVPRRKAGLAAQATELYELLVRPVEPYVLASDRVALSLSGPLHSLPFAALVRKAPGGGAGRYLAESKPLHVVASATVYAELKKARRASTRSDGRLAAFGDPRYPPLSKDEAGRIENPDVRAVSQTFGLTPLPFTREEVDRIARLFPDRTESYIGERATEERAKALGADVRYVHFACHGFLDERFPLNSSLALTIPARPAERQDNGLLQAWEIFDKVRIDADLVTLSACSTALGRELGGEGLVGLTRAFHCAGARSVLATLWGVSDVSTPLLMQRFYAHLKAGMTRDRALQAAQVDFIGRRAAASGAVVSDLSHPFRWAAFQLSGDWR
ncbi:MAG TPA: CHAT domain-containing tetratricopeptide repeat protein [Vicinamibacteria bacterium]|nr:CHAT domain-containing tetratricopeptide repeat protein [Vicinamibacteria bacterium]